MGLRISEKASRKSIAILILLYFAFVQSAYVEVQPADELLAEEQPFIYGGLAWSPDGKFLAAGTSNGVRLHSVDDLATVTRLGSQEFVTALAWSPDGRNVVSGNFDGEIQIWDVGTHQLLVSIEGHTRAITSIAWSPDGLFFASGSLDDTIRIWNAVTFEPSQIIEVDAEITINYSVTWSPGGEQIAAYGADKGRGGITVWNATTGVRRSFWRHNRETSVVKWSPNGDVIAVGSFGGQVRFFDANTGEVLTTLEADSYTVHALAWSPDGTYLASNGGYGTVGDRKLRVWDAENGTLITEFFGGIMTGDGFYSNALAWSPDGTRLASTSDGGKIYIWETETFQTLAVYDEYLSIVRSS